MVKSFSLVFFTFLCLVNLLAYSPAECALTPDGPVFVDCGESKTFTCEAAGISLKWKINGLRGINISAPFLARNEARGHDRITTNDTGQNTQESVSYITISGFTISDKGGIIQCINAKDNKAIGMANISISLPPPTNVTATVGSCRDVTLQWTQPREPNDLTASVSCTPPSPACRACTTSPCTITGLTPNTEYNFTVTFNSGKCGTTSSTIAGRTEDLQPLQQSTNVAVVGVLSNSVTLQWTQPSEPNDITTSVSCTPPSPGCTACTTSPCTITGLTQDTVYTFTVTLNDGICKTSTNTTNSRTKVVVTLEFLNNLTAGFNTRLPGARLNLSLAIAETLTNIEINTTDSGHVQEIVEAVTNVLNDIVVFRARQDGKNVSSYTPEEEDTLNKNMVSTFGILLSDDVVTSVENDTDPSTPTNQSSVIVGVVDTVESLGIVVASSSNTRSNATYQSGNLAMKVEVEKSNGFDFEVELDSVMVSVGAQNDTALVVTSFGYLGSVLPVEDMNDDVDSKVISLQLANRSTGEEVQPRSLGDEYPVKIEFDDVMLTENSSCRFYKDEKDGTGAVWSSEGVETVNCSSGVCCKSKHLTNFAVLVNVGNVQHNPTIETALLALSYIGCGLSIICLIITIIALIIFRYKGQKTPVNFVHINLSVVLLAALVIFVGASYPLRHEFIPCAIVTGVLHYLFLAVFSWMLCEGVMLYLMLVKVFSSLPKKLWFFLLLGYGLPIIPVVVTAGVRHNNYVNRLGCWLSSDIHYGTIWGFAAPVVVIMLINLVFLVLAVVQLCKSQKVSSVRETSNTRVALNSVRASILLLPLLGLTWVFGFITFDVQTESDTAWEVIPLIFQIIFILLNSTQGVMIFVFYVLRNEKVLPLWKKCFAKCCPCCKAKLDAATSSKSRTDTVQLGKFTSTSGAVSNTDQIVSAHNGGNGVKDTNSVAPVPDVEFSPGDPVISSNSEMKQTSPM